MVSGLDLLYGRSPGASIGVNRKNGEIDRISYVTETRDLIIRGGVGRSEGRGGFGG